MFVVAALLHFHMNAVEVGFVFNFMILLRCVIATFKNLIWLKLHFIECYFSLLFFSLMSIKLMGSLGCIWSGLSRFLSPFLEPTVR